MKAKVEATRAIQAPMTITMRAKLERPQLRHQESWIGELVQRSPPAAQEGQERELHCLRHSALSLPPSSKLAASNVLDALSRWPQCPPGGDKWGDGAGQVRWAFYKKDSRGEKVPTGVWCKDCVGAFLIRYAFLFAKYPQLQQQQQLQQFMIFLRVNPTIHADFREVSKAFIKWKITGTSSFAVELVKVRVTSREAIQDPHEALLDCEAMKEALEEDDLDDKRLRIKPVSFTRPGGQSEKGFRANCEHWMLGKSGIYPLIRERINEKTWEWDINKQPCLSSSQAEEVFNTEIAKKSAVLNSPCYSIAKYKSINDGEIVVNDDGEEELVAVDEDKEDLSELDSELEQQMNADKKKKGTGKGKKPKKDNKDDLDVFDSVEDEFVATAEKIEGLFLNNEWLKTSWRASTTLKTKHPFSHAESLYTELRQSEDPRVASNYSHICQILDLVKAAAKVNQLNLGKSGGAISPTGLTEITFLTSTIGAFTKNEYKFSFEYTVSYFSAVAAQQYYLTNESSIAFKNVLSASGDANFVVMCANNSVDGGEVAYAVAAFMFKRILPAEAPKDDAAGRIEKPMALVTALMSACEDASVPESLDMKSSRLFQELQLIDNVFHHKGDLPSLSTKWDHAKGDVERSKLVHVLNSRGFAKDMSDNLTQALAEFRSEQALDDLSAELRAHKCISADELDWMQEFFTGDTAAIENCIKEFKLNIPATNKLIKSAHKDSSSIQGRMRCWRRNLQFIVALRLVSQPRKVAADNRISSKLVSDVFDLDGETIGDKGMPVVTIAKRDHFMAVATANEVNTSEITFANARTLAEPRKLQSAMDAFCAAAVAFATEKGFENHDIISKLDESIKTSLSTIEDTLISLKQPLVTMLLSKRDALPLIDMEALKWAPDNPGFSPEELSSLQSETAQDLVQKIDELWIFLDLKEIADEIDDIDTLKVKMASILTLKECSKFQKVFINKNMLNSGDVFTVGKATRQAVSRTLADAGFKTATDDEFKNIRSFLANFRQWCSECMGQTLEQHFEDLPVHEKVIKGQVPAGFAALSEQTDPKEVFVESQSAPLRALCDFADRPSIVTATGELSTMEQRFECDLKLSGLKADAWPDVEEKNVRLKECLKAGRTCIAVRSALDCVLLADKDHQR